MKKLNILLLSALALGITTTSCSKKEDTATSSSIVGKWQFDTYTKTNSTGTSDKLSYAYSADCKDFSFWSLKSDKSISEQQVGNSSDPCVVNNYTGTYTYNNNILHVTEPADQYEADFTIVSVTSTNMTVKSINPSNPGEYLTYYLVKK